MSKKTVWLSGIVAALIIGAISIYGLSRRVGYTLDDLTVLGENDDYVELSYDGYTGKLYKHFSFDFSDPDYMNWFGEGSWSAMTLLSPLAKTVPEYMALQRDIRAGQAGFRDNRIDAVDGVARFESVAPSNDMETAKSMLQHDRLWFVKGDDLWFKARFFLESGVPFALASFQERGRIHSPGPRIIIRDQTHIGIEMKYVGKPTMYQSIAEIPTGRWFEIKLHMQLDEEVGEIQVWQDGIPIIDGIMQTLPEANSVLNSLELGITATAEATVMMVDDVVISHDPL